MKALVIAPQPFFSPRGTPLSVYYRTLVTAELGVEVDLLTYGQGMGVDIPGVRIVRGPRLEFLGKIPVGPSMLKLVHDVFLVFRMIGLLITRKYAFVHAHEEAVFFCLLLRPLFRFRLVYDMHSSLPQQLTSFRFTRSRLLIGLFEKLEVASLRKADAVITICEDLYVYANQYLQDTEKHLLIENSLFDPILFDEEAQPRDLHSSPTADVLDSIPKEKSLVVYAGTLESYQGIDLIVRSIPLVIETCPNTHFVVAGGSDVQVNAFRTLSGESDVARHCTFTGSVPKSTAARLNALASVLLSPRLTGNNTPLKIYEQLASGTPLVATDVRSHTQVLSEDVAFLVDPDPSSFADGIVAALTNVEGSRRKVTNAQLLYQQKYGRDSYEGKMRRVLEMVS